MSPSAREMETPDVKRKDSDASDKASGISTPSLHDEATAEKQPNTDAPASPPDGGIQAWLQVLSGFLLYFNSWGMVTAF